MSTAASRIIAAPGVRTPWQRHLVALGAAWTSILLMFAGDAAHMATIWWTSSTFNHCLLIVPIIAWLVWVRAPALASISPSVWSPGLAIIGAGAMAWLLGDAAGVSLFRHGGLIVMLQGSVVALLGRQVAWALLFPLAYALFLVPVGEELVPALQGMTARISMVLLGVVGIPAHMEGVFITTPHGYFEVAEACSGVKFLVAMLALGVLVAHLGFRSWPRRLIFVAAAIVVPVVANGARAFATIYVAGRTSAQSAAGFDHIVYGWFFFGIVIAALIGGAWHFFDRAPDAPIVVPARTARLGSKTSLPLMLALGLTLAATPQAWAAWSMNNARDIELPPLDAPDIAGWSRVSGDSGAPWTPRFTGADHMLVQRYRNANGDTVDLLVAAFAWQAEGRELVGYGQGAAAPDYGWSWSETAAPPPGGRADRIAQGGVTREVLSFYSVGDMSMGNEAEVKLATLKARLTGGDQTAVAVLVSAEMKGNASARPVLDAFLADLGPVDRFADRITGR